MRPRHGTHRIGLFVTAVVLALIPVRAGAQADAPQEKPTTTVDASRGGVTISSGRNSLTIGARVQFRWTVEDREDGDADLVGSGVGREDGALSVFDVPRLRLSLSGGVYKPWLRYLFQFEFSRTAGAGASKIKDAVVEIRPVGQQYRLSIGQFKAPFGLQGLTSSGRLQFVERAITDLKYTPGRDVGVMVGGTLAGTRFGYMGGVFNGAGESVLQNTGAPLLAGRVFLQPFGSYALSEGAVEEGPRALHLGVAARTGKQIRGRTTAGVIQDADNQTGLGAEFAYRQARFYSTAEYFWMTDEIRNPVIGPDLRSVGFHVQAGYMVVPRTTEIGVRYAAVDPDTDMDETTLREIRGVVGYFWRGHNLKLQADVGQLRYDAAYAGASLRARVGLPLLGARLTTGRALADTQLRVQMQVSF